MASKAGARIKITLRCSECKQRNYNTMKNKKNTPDRLELNKYCPFCRKHTVHNETEKKSKPGVFARIGKWLKDMKSELKKVQWPTRKQTVNNTLIVIACVVVVGIFIWLFDLVANKGIGLILSLLG